MNLTFSFYLTLYHSSSSPLPSKPVAIVNIADFITKTVLLQVLFIPNVFLYILTFKKTVLRRKIGRYAEMFAWEENVGRRGNEVRAGSEGRTWEPAVADDCRKMSSATQTRPAKWGRHGVISLHFLRLLAAVMFYINIYFLSLSTFTWLTCIQSYSFL